MRDDLLARGDLAADHPVERSAGKDLFGPFRHHPGDVDVTLRKPLLLCGLHPFGNPFLEFFDGIAANGKLEEVKGHGCSLARAVRADQSSDAAGACAAGEIGVGAAGGRFAAGGFFATAAAGAGAAAWAARAAADGADAAAAAAGGLAPVPGSGVMMLTGGVWPRSGTRHWWAGPSAATAAASPAGPWRHSLWRVPGRRVARDQIIDRRARPCW